MTPPEVFGDVGRERLTVAFSGAPSGPGPLTWGQRAIVADMVASGSQFTMPGRMSLPAGQSVQDVVARIREVIGRHAALRTRLLAGGWEALAGGGDGQLSQETAGSGELGLDILTLPDDADAGRYAIGLFGAWPRVRFDFHRDWPLRMALLRQRGACTHLVWVLSHLVADGSSAMLVLTDLLGRTGRDGQPGQLPAQLPDVARSEQEPQAGTASGRTMRYWQTQLRDIPALTFGEPSAAPGPRYRQVRFRSVAAHLGLLAIAARTGTDVSRVTLAVVATAIGRVTGVHPVTLNVMVNNRFRRGLADVVAPVAQNSVLTIDVTDTTVDAAAAQASSASLIAGMRAYYDPSDLAALTAQLDAERGYPARVSCRFNDQRTMILRADGGTGPVPPEPVTPERLAGARAQTSLAWLEPIDGLHVQANMVIENQPDVVSLFVQFDHWSLRDGQVEALVRAVEDVAVEAAFDPAAPTRVPAAAEAAGSPQMPRLPSK
jgi:hypothetical protein